MNWLQDNHELQRAAEHFIPTEDNEIMEISSLDEFYDRVEQPEDWKTLRGSERNYSIHKSDFIFNPPSRSVKPRQPFPQLVHQEAGKRVEGHEVKTETAPLLFTEIKATELWLKKARRIGESLVIPGIAISYTNLDFARGYSGYKSWLIVDSDQKLEDVFWRPISGSRNAGNNFPVFDEAGESFELPDLGVLCARQIQAFGRRLLALAENPGTRD